MYPLLKTTLALLSIAAGLLATLFLVVMYVAGAANMSPERLKTHYLQLKLIAAGGLACTVVTSVLLAKHHPTAATLVGIFPAAFCVVYFVIALSA